MSGDGYEDFGLVVPFVGCIDHGGTFDPAAFTAGWEMGQLWLRVGVALAAQCVPLTATIRRVNVPQADLIAMHYGLHLTESEWSGLDDDNLKTEWAHVVIGSEP